MVLSHKNRVLTTVTMKKDAPQSNTTTLEGRTAFHLNYSLCWRLFSFRSFFGRKVDFNTISKKMLESVPLFFSGEKVNKTNAVSKGKSAE